MSGVVYRFRSELRARWRAWLALGLLVGAVGGTVVVLAAGARRTDSAHDRFLSKSRAYDVGVATYCSPDVRPGDVPQKSGCHAEVARLPAVADATILTDLAAFVGTADGRSLLPDPEDNCYSGPGEISVGLDFSGRFGTAINRERMVAGRRANPEAADEVMISHDTARRHHLGPGSELVIRLYRDCGDNPKTWHAPMRVHIVGVQLSPGEVRPPSGLYLQSVVVTPAFVRAAGAIPRRDDYLAVRLRPGATPETLRAQAQRAGYTVEVALSQADSAKAVERAIRPSAVSLAVLAAMTALAGAAVIGALLVRQATLESSDDTTLSALGMGRGRRLVLGLVRAAAVGLVAAMFSTAVAIVASPAMPIGLARLVEPDRGFAFDAVTLGLGALATFFFVVAVSSLAVWRVARSTGRSRARDVVRRARVANAAARAGFAPTAVSGARLALERGTGTAAVPVLSSFVGLIIAVAATVGALTFGAGLAHLRSSPRLIGWNWDVVLTYPQADPPIVPIAEARARAQRALDGYPGVTAYARGTVWTPFPQGRQLQAGPRRLDVGGLMAWDGTADVGPSVISGRKPAAPDEIMFGQETLDDLRLHLGDEVEVYGQNGTWDKPGDETAARVRVVGTGVVPLSERFGRGAALTLEGLARLSDRAEEQAYFIRLRSPAEAKGVLEAFQHAFPEAPPESIGSFGLDSLADPGLSLDQIDSVPRLFAGLMGLMAAAVLTHVLVSANRARRRDLAVLRALGFSRGQTVRTVTYESLIYALGALAVGAPLGVALGRVVWRLYADGLGVVPEAVTPWIACALTVAGAVALALLIAMRPAWTALRIRPAVALRTE